MKMKALLMAGMSALMLSSLALPASAAPAFGVLKPSAIQSSAVDHVNYRRCWHRHGGLVCRRYYSSYYDDGYYGYGYGPGVGLYFGGGGWGRGGHWGGGYRGHR